MQYCYIVKLFFTILDEILTGECIAKKYSNTFETTLAVASWTGSKSPFSYAVTIPSSVTISNILKVEIAPAYSATVSQRIAYMKCAFSGGSISGRTLTIQALGKKPTESIPIIVIIRGEI